MKLAVGRSLAACLVTCAVVIFPATLTESAKGVSTVLKPNTPEYQAAESVLTSVVNSVEQWAASADGQFVAAEIDVAQNLVRVYRTASTQTPAGDLLAGYKALSGTVELVFLQAPLSNAQKIALDALVEQTMPTFSTMDIEPTSWGLLDGWDHPYVVEYRGSGELTESVIDRFSIYGAGTVIFRRGDVVLATRQQDTDPFYGGDGIHSGPGVTSDGEIILTQCSSGFIDYNATTNKYYALTSSHCSSPLGSDFYAWWGTSGGVHMGSTSKIEADTDTAFINLSEQGNDGRPIIFNGSLPTNGTDIVGIHGADMRTGVTSGGNICMSGATSGSTCNADWGAGGLLHWTVTNPYSGTSASVGGYRANSYDGSSIIASGDSGGPVYHNSSASNQKDAKGIISAIPGNAVLNSCPTYVGARPFGDAVTCGKAAFVVTMDRVLANHPDASLGGF